MIWDFLSRLDSFHSVKAVYVLKHCRPYRFFCLVVRPVYQFFLSRKYWRAPSLARVRAAIPSGVSSIPTAVGAIGLCRNVVPEGSSHVCWYPPTTKRLHSWHLEKGAWNGCGLWTFWESTVRPIRMKVRMGSQFKRSPASPLLLTSAITNLTAQRLLCVLTLFDGIDKYYNFAVGGVLQCSGNVTGN